jgi:hypothetical protein
MITNHKIKKPIYALYFNMYSQMHHLTIHVKILIQCIYWFLNLVMQQHTVARKILRSQIPLRHAMFLCSMEYVTINLFQWYNKKVFYEFIALYIQRWLGL